MKGYRAWGAVLRTFLAGIVLAGVPFILRAQAEALSEPQQVNGAEHRARTIQLNPGDPLPALQVGDVLNLTPGRYVGPWEIAIADVVIRGAGATLVSQGEGSTLVLAAPGIRVEGLSVDGSGPVDDLYTPDAAYWLFDCVACVLDGVSSVNARSAVRAEGSWAAQVTGASFVGAEGSPAITVFDSPGFGLEYTVVNGFLDGIYIEKSDSASVIGSEFVGAGRYALHVMFSRDTLLEGNTVRGGRVGSAAMYGRGVIVRGNRFEGHVGPLAFGLLLQELEEAVVVGNQFEGNTVSMLVVSAPDVRVEANEVSGSGFGMLVQRTRSGPVSAVVVEGNRFRGNVSDIAVDDPDAALRVHGNQFEAASRLDMDGDGVSDVPHLPSSSFDMLASRQPDLSLFALSPGVILWQTAEASVPALRLATLQDASPLLTADGPWRVAATAPLVHQPADESNGAPLALGLIVSMVVLGTAFGRTPAERA